MAAEHAYWAFLMNKGHVQRFRNPLHPFFMFDLCWLVMKRNDSIEITKAIKMKSGTKYTISSIINHFGDVPEEGHYNILIFDNRNDSFVLLLLLFVLLLM